ncbi:MAG: alpha/beta fold hydrolase [Nitrospinota bacterium]
MASLKRVQIWDQQIAYREEGTGDTVLLIHGITTNSFIWRNIIPLLSTTYRVLAIDLLGCGESDKPLDVDYSIKNQAKMLEEFVDLLKLKPFHLVGHDIGGGVCQIFAVNNSKKIVDLTLINSVAYDFWPVQPIIAMRTPIIRQLAMATLNFGLLKMVVKGGLFHKYKLTPELMDLFWVQMKTEEGRKAFLWLAKCLDNSNLLEIEEKLRNIPLPVLIIRGEEDIYLGGKIAEKLHNEIPGSKLVLIPSAGHFIQEDEPEMMVKAIREFLQKKSSLLKEEALGFET